MKELKTIAVIAILFMVSFSANAQTKKGVDFFLGKWNLEVIGTPNGDSKFVLALEQKEGKLTGNLQDSTGTEFTKLTNAEVKDSTLTIYFSVNSYDVSATLDKKDDDHIKGSVLGMFDAKGVRIKETAVEKK